MEIEKLILEEDINIHEDGYYGFSMAYKYYKIKIEGIIVTEDEINEMISYFEKINEYEICEYLKNI